METPSNRICRIVWKLSQAELTELVDCLQTGRPNKMQARDQDDLLNSLPWIVAELDRQRAKRSAAAKKAAATRKAIAAGDELDGKPLGIVSDTVTADMNLARRLTKNRKRRVIRATKND